jgi:DNA-binding GntR family transcriptional regulator
MAMKYGPIWEYAAQDIKNRIIKGDLEVGQRLIISDLAKHYTVSHIPIREALRHLTSEGFLRNIPRRSFVVKDLSASEIEDNYMVQAVLDGLAARQAATKLNHRNIKKLKRINAQMKKAIDEGNLAKIVQHNNDFHSEIIRASGNNVLEGVLSKLRDQILRFRVKQLSYPGRAIESNDEHEKIVAALESNDGELSQTLAINHVCRAMGILKAQYNGSSSS